MPKNSAEYMRAYRARKKAKPLQFLFDGVTMEWPTASPEGMSCPECGQPEGSLDALLKVRSELGEEVARLKRELAARPTLVAKAIADGRLREVTISEPRTTEISVPRNPYAEFHPAPKIKPKGK